MIKLSELTPDPKNTRIHDEHNLNVIKKSLEKFGQYRPFVVQKKGMIIRVGNGMFQAMKELNMEEGSCVVKDITDEESVALSILDNKASDLSVFDDSMLAEVMSDLSDNSLDLTGFIDVELNNILPDTKIELPQLEEEIPKSDKQNDIDDTTPMPIRQYQIIFDNDDSYKEWCVFANKIKDQYDDTIAEALIKYIRAFKPINVDIIE